MPSSNTYQGSESAAECLVQRRKSKPLKEMADLVLAQGKFGRKVADVVSRFHCMYRKVESGCWEWQFRLTCGYGEMRANRKNVKAHRVSWIIHNGSIPDGMLVCHKCNNKKCVNPTHLYLGTPLQNKLDAVRDGLTPRGESMARAKLTNVSVLQIRELSRLKKRSYSQLALDFSVSKAVIADAVKKRTWRHLP